MKLKTIVAISLIAFISSTSVILLVGLVLVRPVAPTSYTTDPATGQQVPVSGENGATTTDPSQETPAPGPVPTPTTGSVTPTNATPAPTVAPTLRPGATATPRPAPTATPRPPAATPTPTPAPVYCGGRTPCYGRSALASHATTGNCWGYNLDWVINLTNYAPVHPAGPSYIQATATCGKDISGVLKGAVSVSGGSHGHKSATINNSSGSLLTSYRVGYYDATKP